MTKPKTVLVVDDEEFIRMTVKQIFVEENHRVLAAPTGGEALELIKQESVDLVLLDINLPDMNGIRVLEQIREIDSELLVIIATGYASVESAIQAIKLGAYDYIKKPFKADAIKLIARLALETSSLKKTVRQLKHERRKSIESILGSSKQIEQVRHHITEFAQYESETVLITGESGSGKELVAQAIHSMSPRAENEFVEINCASIPENLLESELFGYEKGAFTDAKMAKAGLLEKADGGSLFLDEIGEMSISLQAALLRVLEQKRFRRIGSTEDIDVNLRVIAATNTQLKDAIAEKRFREDLYYRLNVLRIVVPPLRERGEDVIELANHFIAQFNRRYNKKIKSLSPSAQDVLCRYPWPGNVRELKNTIERICILQKQEVIEAHQLPSDLLTDQLEDNVRSETDTGEVLEGSFDEIMRQTEIRLLKQAYMLSGKNTSQASRLLKIPRETLRYKLAKYDITDGEN